MAKFPNKIIALLLALMLVSPANAGLSSWMAMSMADSQADHVSHHVENGFSHNQHESHGAHSHDSHTGTEEHHKKNSKTSHNDEDCNEHCVSCANHCSNPGILSHPISLTDLSKTQHGFESGTLSKHTDLLYRPPIRN